MRQEISFGKLKLTNNKGASNNNGQVSWGSREATLRPAGPRDCTGTPILRSIHCICVRVCLQTQPPLYKPGGGGKEGNSIVRLSGEDSLAPACEQEVVFSRARASDRSGGKRVKRPRRGFPPPQALLFN